MIDYAYPTMMAEKALKDLHNAMLDKDYANAIEHGKKALAEVYLAIRAVEHEQEKA